MNDLRVIVSAQNGSIIRYGNLACTFRPYDYGTANTKYSGVQSINTDIGASGSYQLNGIYEGVEFKTFNAIGSFDEITAINTATEFTDNDNNWTTAELGANNIATDVHWGVEKTLDYWLTKHNRNSYDGQGGIVKSYVHYSPAFNNALWSLDNQVMFFGDGYVDNAPAEFSALTSLDLVAHEFGHGVNQFTSNLLVANGAESWALNEGFSDIWGACVEANAAPNKQRWLIGEEFVKEAPFYLRSLQNPPSAWSLPVSDTYNDVNWNNYTTGHIRSGVLSKWFYLISEGGTGTNGIGNSYDVFGLTMAKAEKIAYATLVGLNSNATFALARLKSIQVAQQEYGVNSCEVKSVTDAWYAVGVGLPYNGTTPVFSTPFSIGGNYTILDITSGKIDYKTYPTIPLTYTWYVNGIQQPSTTNLCTISTPNYCLNGGIETITNSVKVKFCNKEFACNPVIPVCGYAEIWNFPVNCNFNAGSGGNPSFKTSFSQTGSNKSVEVSPNPSNGEFLVNLSSTEKSCIERIVIVNKMGKTIFMKNYKDCQKSQKLYLNVDISDVYFLKVFDGVDWIDKQVQIIK
jgi:Zn-dependent metalloprotease